MLYPHLSVCSTIEDIEKASTEPSRQIWNYSPCNTYQKRESEFSRKSLIMTSVASGEPQHSQCLEGGFMPQRRQSLPQTAPYDAKGLGENQERFPTIFFKSKPPYYKQVGRPTRFLRMTTPSPFGFAIIRNWKHAEFEALGTKRDRFSRQD